MSRIEVYIKIIGPNLYINPEPVIPSHGRGYYRESHQVPDQGGRRQKGVGADVVLFTFIRGVDNKRTFRRPICDLSM